MRFYASVLCSAVLFSFSAVAQNHADVLVTEADFQKWDALRFEESLQRARTERDRSQREAHKAKYEAAVAASGLSEERRTQIEGVLTEIEQTMMEAETGAISNADLDTYLSAFKPQTVEVARRHLEAIRDPDHMDRARQQARTEALEARKGDAVKAADLQGLWVVDVDASLRSILGAMADAPGMEAARKDMEKSFEGMSYEFKGNQMTATSMSNGKKDVSTATFRLDGHKLYFGAKGGPEGTLDVGMKDGRLVLGMGFAAAHYKKAK